MSARGYGLAALMALGALAGCHRDWDAALNPGVSGEEGGQRPDAAAGDGGVSGLIASWPFNEGSSMLDASANGSIAHDVTGNEHDGTISGGQWVAGHSGNTSALLLNGTSDVVTVLGSHAFDRDATTSFTMTAWIKKTQGADYNTSEILSVSFGATKANFAMEAYDNTHMAYWAGEEGAGASAVSLVTFDGNWHHMAIVVDATPSAQSFFDGEPGASSVPDATVRMCEGVLLGGSNYGDRLPAAIEGVHYYGRALSAPEVMEDMNQ